MKKSSHQAVSCPNCQAAKTKVTATYYTEHAEIVRQRECKECSFKFATIATCEDVIEPEFFRVKVPLKGTAAYKNKICTVSRVS